MRLANIVVMVKNTVTEMTRILTTRKGLQSLYRISLYKNAIYLMVSSIALSLSGFFFWIVAARLYPVEAVGLASATLGACGILTLFSALGLDQGLIRFLPGAGQKAREMINSCFSLVSIIAFVLAVIFIAGLKFWSPALLPILENPIFIGIFILFTTISMTQNFSNQIFIAERRSGFALSLNLIFGLSRFIPLLLLSSIYKSFGIFMAIAIAVSITAAISITIFLPIVDKDYKLIPLISKKIIKDMIHYSFANYVTIILWILPQTIMPLLIVNLLGTEQNAYYYIGWSVASILFAIPSAVSFALFAEGSHNENKFRIEIIRGLKFLSVILIPAIIILGIFNNKILSFFGSAYSINTTKLLWILTFSALPLSINYIYYAMKKVEMKMKTLIMLAAFITCTILGLSYILLPQIGILGAGIAWLSGHSAAAIFVMYDIFKRH